MEKKCTKCGVEKVISDYPNRKNSSGKIIKNAICRGCLAEKQRLHRAKNEEIVKTYDRKRYQESKEAQKTRSRQYYQENKILIGEKQRNSRKGKEYRRKYYQSNKVKLDAQNKANFYKRLRTDILFRLKHNVGVGIRRSLKRGNHYKKSRTQEILGCTFDELKLHLEAQFEPWMNWDNYGLYNGEESYGWDIDHIIPTSSATTEVEVLSLFYYSNLQPLCSKVNRDIKKAKVYLDI